ncbi:hypothetical protein F5884DRAFT_327052 [Xylogone sp. PMI_703]|nr:hypothetical protein F5884DRAFT_327052 [Xylogone sp. PMI_703]
MVKTRKMLKEPAELPIGPGELQDQDNDVLQRIHCLECTHIARADDGCSDKWEFDERDLVNRAAVLNAYRQHRLKVEAGKVTLWFAGHMVMGPLLQRELSHRYIIDNTPKWIDQYGPGRLWFEGIIIRARPW